MALDGIPEGFSKPVSRLRIKRRNKWLIMHPEGEKGGTRQARETRFPEYLAGFQTRTTNCAL